MSLVKQNPIGQKISEHTTHRRVNTVVLKFHFS